MQIKSFCYVTSLHDTAHTHTHFNVIVTVQQQATVIAFKYSQNHYYAKVLLHCVPRWNPIATLRNYHFAMESLCAVNMFRTNSHTLADGMTKLIGRCRWMLQRCCCYCQWASVTICKRKWEKSNRRHPTTWKTLMAQWQRRKQRRWDERGEQEGTILSDGHDWVECICNSR